MKGSMYMDYKKLIVERIKEHVDLEKEVISELLKEVKK